MEYSQGPVHTNTYERVTNMVYTELKPNKLTIIGKIFFYLFIDKEIQRLLKCHV